MRRLMWVTIGFAIACGVCVFVSASLGIPVVFLLSAGAVAAFLLPENKARFPLVLICIGCVIGLLWVSLFRVVYIRPALDADGTERFVTIHATSYSRSARYGTSVEGTMRLEDKTYFVRVYLDDGAEAAPGDNISGVFQFRYTGAGGSREPTSHQGDGIYLLAYQKTDAVIAAGEKRWLDYPAMVSREIGQLLDVFFPSDTAPFAKALLLGDTEGLTYRQDTDLKLSGIRHVVAVSGLHVSIVFALVSTLTCKKPWLRMLIGIPVLLFFAAMTGFSPSVNRACLMCGLMMLSMVLRRDYDGASALAFASLVILMANPLAITSAAFQLSVSCVAGIYLLQDKIRLWLLSHLGKGDGRNRISRLKRWLAGNIAVSISAMVFSLPLSVWYFDMLSLVGVLTNLLTLWVISFVFCGTLAVCVLGMLNSTLALFLARVVSLPIRYVLLVAKILGSFPLAAVYTQSVYITAWLVFVYILLAVFLLARRRNALVAICCAVTGLCVALTASWLEPMSDTVRLTVLDVGHGQSILLQWSGYTFLVDCGGDSDTGTADLTAQTLLSQGIDHLDGMIITHKDYDHAGGAPHLLSRMRADCVLAPEIGEDWDFETETVMPMEARSFYADGGILTVYGPISAKGGNENSLCVLFEQENCAILITGDRSAFGERMLMRHVDLPYVDVLIAGHHGSPESTGEALLEQVLPGHVVISGETGDTELLQRLARYGCQVWRTDRSGTIVFRR